jgi:hypothetical protein
MSKIISRVELRCLKTATSNSDRYFYRGMLFQVARSSAASLKIQSRPGNSNGRRIPSC